MSQVTYKSEKVSPRRVYYTGSDTLLEGYCLCYDRDYGTAAAEEVARAYRVEKPDATNLKYFAGVVSDEDAGRTGPCWVTILEPQPCPGRLVNVYTNLNCTLGATLLAVGAGSYAAVAAGANAVTVATAMQTIDRSGAAGVALAQLEGASSIEVDAAACVAQTQDALTDNTAGTAGAALKAIRSDTAAHTAADVADNEATLAAQLAKVRTDVAGILAALKNANLMAQA